MQDYRTSNASANSTAMSLSDFLHVFLIASLSFIHHGTQTMTETTDNVICIQYDPKVDLHQVKIDSQLSIGASVYTSSGSFCW